jgi:hypothetical protein
MNIRAWLLMAAALLPLSAQAQTVTTEKLSSLFAAPLVYQNGRITAAFGTVPNTFADGGALAAAQSQLAAAQATLSSVQTSVTSAAAAATTAQTTAAMAETMAASATTAAAAAQLYAGDQALGVSVAAGSTSLGTATPIAHQFTEAATLGAGGSLSLAAFNKVYVVVNDTGSSLPLFPAASNQFIAAGGPQGTGASVNIAPWAVVTIVPLSSTSARIF